MAAVKKTAVKKTAAKKQARPKERNSTHLQGEAGEKLVEQSLPYWWVVRKMTPDYALDLHVEVFSEPDFANDLNARALGEHFYIQVKAAATLPINRRVVQERHNVANAPLAPNAGSDKFAIDVVDFVMDTNSLVTIESMGSAVPVLLCLVDVSLGRVYYVCLNDYIAKVLVPENPKYRDQGTVKVYIPAWNVLDQKDPSFGFIKMLARRSKFYSLFSTFAYQYAEVDSAMSRLDVFMQDRQTELVQVPSEIIDMVAFFIESNLRLDLWGSEPVGRWNQLQEVFDRAAALAAKLDYFRAPRTAEEVIVQFIIEAREVFRLGELNGRMYEEVAREARLPTYFASAFLDSSPPFAHQPTLTPVSSKAQAAKKTTKAPAAAKGAPAKTNASSKRPESSEATTAAL